MRIKRSATLFFAACAAVLGLWSASAMADGGNVSDSSGVTASATGVSIQDSISGSASLPGPDPGWALETSLDVEW